MHFNPVVATASVWGCLEGGRVREHSVSLPWSGHRPWFLVIISRTGRRQRRCQPSLCVAGPCAVGFCPGVSNSFCKCRAEWAGAARLVLCWFFLSVRLVLDYSVGVVLDYCPWGVVRFFSFVFLSFFLILFLFLQWKFSLRQTVPLQNDLQR